MSRKFTRAWIAIAAVVIVAEFTPGLGAYRDALLALALAATALVEGIALGRPEPGDTGSEHLWSFYAWRPARLPALLGIGLYCAIRLLDIGAEPLLLAGRDAGRVALAVGFGGWFIPHLLFRGRYG
jgi:hypothetical protein